MWAWHSSCLISQPVHFIGRALLSRGEGRTDEASCRSVNGGSRSVRRVGRGSLSVYNIAGREVDVIVDGEINQRDNFIQVAIDSGRMPSCARGRRPTATGTASGRAYSQTGKMLVVR